MKRDLYEGGIRVPFIAYWPGTTPADTVSDHIGYFGDLMATAADLADVTCPEGLDSVSIAPPLRGTQSSSNSTNFYIGNSMNGAASRQPAGANGKPSVCRC